MTTFTPDRPDWTQESTASVVYGQEVILGPLAEQTFGLVGVASYTLVAQSVGDGNPILLNLAFEVNPSTAIGIGAIVLTALENPDIASLVFFECPSYGGLLIVENFDEVNSVLVNVYSSNRTVAEPRYTLDTTPGRTLQSAVGFTASTPTLLASLDGGGSGYAANVITGVTARSSGAGDLEFWYRDAGGNVQIIPVMTVTGTPAQSVTLPLPQCTGQFYFTPTGTDASGQVTVLAYPARS